jgi:hypothetical protein
VQGLRLFGVKIAYIKRNNLTTHPDLENISFLSDVFANIGLGQFLFYQIKNYK